MSTVHSGDIPLIEPKDLNSMKWLSFDFTSALATNENISSLEWLINDIPVENGEEVDELAIRKSISDNQLQQILVAGGIEGYRYKFTAVAKTNYRTAVVRSVYMMIDTL